MSEKKNINEEDLKQASGGLKFRGWVCPKCPCEVKLEDLQTKFTDEGVLMYYCPDCNEYYPKSDWDHRFK